MGEDVWAVQVLPTVSQVTEWVPGFLQSPPSSALHRRYERGPQEGVATPAELAVALYQVL